MKNLFTIGDLIRFLISATALTLIVLTTGCKGGDGGGGTGSTPETAAPTSSTPAVPGSDEDYLPGRWLKLGSYCGATWTASASPTYMEITANGYTAEIVTMCGAQPVAVQAYTLTYTSTVLTSRLTQSWQSGNCPVTLQAVANAPTVNRNYVIQGDELTITTGTCAGGQVAQSVYEKE